MLKGGKNSIYVRWFYLFLVSFLLGVMIMNLGTELFCQKQEFSVLHQ